MPHQLWGMLCIVASITGLSSTSSYRPVPKVKQRAAGFVFPLALSASSVLLLGSALIHTLSLRQRLSVHSSSERDLVSDQLRSAAHAFVSLATGPQACLLFWPSDRWDSNQINCSGADADVLRQGLVGKQGWHLQQWQPRSDFAELRLRLQRSGSNALFRVQLDSAVPRVLAISDPQLRRRFTTES